MIINDIKIAAVIKNTPDEKQVIDILQKSEKLEKLTLTEVATLLNVEDDALLVKIFEAAKKLKEAIYGKRLVIFAPLYISNLCNNECLYCAFRVNNKNLARRSLTQDEIKHETEELLKTGQKRVLLVSGEAYPKDGLSYILKSIETVYSARDGQNNIRRVNVNIAPLEIKEFKQLKAAHIGTYQLFQETYHRETYKKIHLRGPKSDYDYRLDAVDRAFTAGIDDVGIGILFGLTDYKYEVLALISHIKYLEEKFGMGPHTISVPRLEPATGSDIASHPPHQVSDKDFKKIIAILRLAVPYTGIILSTRETPQTRSETLSLGVSQISAGSKTNPGGYSENSKSAEQFSLGDHRSLDEVIYDILDQGYIPSFCTGCYRIGRTGLDFMEYAKPGEIKKKCLPNALLTFQEYLDDYASTKTKQKAHAFMQKEIENLPAAIKDKTIALLKKIQSGTRDLFV